MIPPLTTCARLAAAMFMALALAACGSLEQPFAKSSDPVLAQSRPRAPALVLDGLNDVPPPQAARLRKALGQALARRGVPTARNGRSARGWRLTGRFEPYRDDFGQRRLAYAFTLRGPSAARADEISGSEPLAGTNANPWNGINHAAMTRISERVAEGISARLAQMGYATQSAGLAPPPDTLVEAGPNAEGEIDPDLLAGLPPPANPLATPPATGAPGAPATPAAPSRASAARRDAPAAATSSGREAATLPRKKKSARSGGEGSRTRIATVAVTGVSGAPGKGNRQLAAAMRGVLRRAGWPVRTRPRDDSMRISGKVSLGAKGPSGQRVAIAWTVKSPTGKVLGVIRQQNTVPPGSLDKGFGPAAQPVAEAAAEGIFQLVRKLRRR